MDVVALAQLGFPNAVATLGTACSAEHVQKLFRFTDAIVFSFDGYNAARRAAARALEASLPFATDTRSVRFLFLPPEHDPDSYVREHGAQGFEACVAEAIPLSRQLIEAARDGCDTASAEGRARLLAQAKPMWLALPEGALKMQLLGDLAQAAALSTDDLTRLWQAAATGRPRPPREREHGLDDHARSGDSWSAEPPPEYDHGSFEPSEQPARAWRKEGRRPWVDKPYFGKRKPPEEGVGLPRAQPTSPADSAIKMLLLNSAWWEQLDAGDLELLHGLPEPHRALCAWMERQVQADGPIAWAVWQEALRGTEWAGVVGRVVTSDALQDDLQFADLRRVLDGMWVRKLGEQLNQLSERAATDPAALAEWQKVNQQRLRRLEALSQAPRPLT